MLLLPTLVILLFFYVISRKARVPTHGGTQARIDSEEGQVARAEAAILEAVKICQQTVALSHAQKERLERAVSELAQVLKGSPQPEV
jgi:hypothetical protein